MQLEKQSKWWNVSISTGNRNPVHGSFGSWLCKSADARNSESCGIAISQRRFKLATSLIRMLQFSETASEFSHRLGQNQPISMAGGNVRFLQKRTLALPHKDVSASDRKSTRLNSSHLVIS